MPLPFLLLFRPDEFRRKVRLLSTAYPTRTSTFWVNCDAYFSDDNISRNKSKPVPKRTLVKAHRLTKVCFANRCNVIESPLSPGAVWLRRWQGVHFELEDNQTWQISLLIYGASNAFLSQSGIILLGIPHRFLRPKIECASQLDLSCSHKSLTSNCLNLKNCTLPLDMSLLHWMMDIPAMHSSLLGKVSW